MNRKIRYLFFTIPILMIIAGIAIFLHFSGESRLTILYTASLNGNLDGCICKGYKRAGLVKRAYYLKNQNSFDQFLLLDAGDVLPAIPEDPSLLRGIIETYEEIKYDAVAVGEQDFSPGMDFFLDNFSRIPFISHNIYIDGELISKNPLLTRRGNLDVYIFSVTEPELIGSLGIEDRSRVSAAPVEDTLALKVPEARKAGANLILSIYHGPYEGAKKLAEAVPGIDIIIFGHEHLLSGPEVVGGTLLVSPGEQGNGIGILDLRIKNGRIRKFTNTFRLFSFENDPDDPAVRGRIEAYVQEMVERLWQQLSEE